MVAFYMHTMHHLILAGHNGNMLCLAN